MFIYCMDYDIDEITQPDGFIHVYGDGSCFRAVQRKHIGFSFAIATNDSQSPIVQSYTYKRINEAGGAFLNASQQLSFDDLVYTAEFLATIEALEQLPPNSSIKLHTDNHAVYEYYRVATGSNKASNYHPNDNVSRITPLLKERLDAAISRHKIIDINDVSKSLAERISKTSQYYSRISHNAAVIGSGNINKLKVATDPETGAIYSEEIKPSQYAFIACQWPQGTNTEVQHDSTGSIEIIDLTDGNSEPEEPFEYGSLPPPKPNP